MTEIIRIVGISIVLIFPLLNLQAQEVAATLKVMAIEPAILSAVRWRGIGPDRGGRSIAVSGVKGRPREAYFGAVGGGLWKTIDAGNSWAPVTEPEFRLRTSTRIVVASAAKQSIPFKES